MCSPICRLLWRPGFVNRNTSPPPRRCSHRHVPERSAGEGRRVIGVVTRSTMPCLLASRHGDAVLYRSPTGYGGMQANKAWLSGLSPHLFVLLCRSKARAPAGANTGFGPGGLTIYITWPPTQSPTRRAHASPHRRRPSIDTLALNSDRAVDRASWNLPAPPSASSHGVSKVPPCEYTRTKWGHVPLRKDMAW